jgi:hypothetical protein
MDQKTRMKAEVERWRESGLTEKEFSQQLGIKVATSAYRISRSKEEDKTGLVPLRPEQRYLAGEIEITYLNGVRLKVSSSDPAFQAHSFILMFSLSYSHRYFLYQGYCDMRKSFDGLCGLVTFELRRETSSG